MWGDDDDDFDIDFDVFVDCKPQPPSEYYLYRCKNEFTWMTIDKTILHISKMTSSHINNCIRMLERATPPQTDTLAYKGLCNERTMRKNV